MYATLVSVVRAWLLGDVPPTKECSKALSLRDVVRVFPSRKRWVSYQFRAVGNRGGGPLLESKMLVLHI